MATAPSGFDYRAVGPAEVRITHHGRPATTLRSDAARRFVVDVEDDDPQELMARLTGNYKHGNERTGQDRPATAVETPRLCPNRVTTAHSGRIVAARLGNDAA